MDIMLDLETLSSAPNAAIVAIGACAFGWKAGQSQLCNNKKFYVVVDSASAQKFGGYIDARTVSWWMQQSEKARCIFQEENYQIDAALELFRNFTNQFYKPRIWGNGASFDNVVLRTAYDRMGKTAPWEYRDERCYRTLKNLRPDIPFERKGVAHNALDDAVDQARHAERILAAMKEHHA